MKPALILLTGLAAASLTACAEPAPGTPPYPGSVALASPRSLAPGACFRSRDIRNHTIGDAHTLYLDVNGRAVYRVQMQGACLAGAVSSDPIITREPPGTSIICRGMDLDIAIDKGGVTTPCIVGSIEALSPQEAAALPPKLRP